MTVASDTRPPRHIFDELGLTVEAVGDEVHGIAEVVPHMCLPGTESLRISLLVTWTDIVLGHLVARALAHMPLTLELDVHLFEEVRCSSVTTVTRIAKAGRSQVVCTVDFTSETRAHLGFGHGVLTTLPEAPLPPGWGSSPNRPLATPRGELLEPFATRAGCERSDAGTASLLCRPHVLNPAKALNGGITALVVEEAVLSADSDLSAVTSMALRYLRPIRTGPAVATARVRAGLGRVEVHDGGGGALAVLATTRSV